MTTKQLLEVLETIENVLMGFGEYRDVYHFEDRIVFDSAKVSVSVVPSKNTVCAYRTDHAGIYREWGLGKLGNIPQKTRIDLFVVTFHDAVSEILEVAA